ncbi:MAG TPA: GMC oxidoreductase, partial [Longimicrobiales bacterium]|nr:GMC oxidoreductase [Longimicrobiales bacterium]
VLAAGALGTPQLLLASGLEERIPTGHAVGRYLTRHCASIVFGCYRRLPDEGRLFHKQLGFNDFYFGDPRGRAPGGKLGNIQQVQSPSRGTVRTALPRPIPWLLGPLLRRATGLLVLAEDQPRRENHVELDHRERDRFGLPRLVVRHAYSDRDLRARAALADRAREIHAEGGAIFCYEHRIDTFSHALGTVRMGDDEDGDPLTPEGRYRGLENLWVADGSAFPTSAGVNPSLTIAAVGHHVGAGVAREAGRPAAPARG